MLVDHEKSLFINTSESIETIESLDAIAFIPYQQETLVQLEIISKTRVVPEGYENPSSLGNFEKGCYHRVSHASTCNQSKMTFGIFIPSSYANDPYQNNPVLFFLGGLTCDDTNFASKAGQRAFEAAERQGIAIVMPDTSPRGPDVPDGDADVYHTGVGASFYINATASPYNVHYQMYEYITKELPFILESNFNMGKNGLKSICGHNMGGHGALIIALREGSRSWKSVSALGPICNPTQCEWGQMAFEKYFVFPEDEGKMHDAVCLLASLDCAVFDDILIDQGSADPFMEDQLKPDAMIAAAEESSQKVTLNMRQGFDHSYFFVAKFMEDHVDFHATRLLNDEKSGFCC